MTREFSTSSDSEQEGPLNGGVATGKSILRGVSDFFFSSLILCVGFGMLWGTLNFLLLLGLNPKNVQNKGILPLFLCICGATAFWGLIVAGAVSLLAGVTQPVIRALKIDKSRLGLLSWIPAVLFCLFLMAAIVYNAGFLATPAPVFFRTLQIAFLVELLLFAALLFAFFHSLLSSAQSKFRRLKLIGGTVVALLFSVGILAWHQPSKPESSRPGPGLAKEPFPAPGPVVSKLILIGLDGADWRIIDKLIQRNELPNLEHIISRGSRGNMKTLRPTKSPIIWTTLATGLPPEKHGITDFTTAGFLKTGIDLNQCRFPRNVGFSTITDTAHSLGLYQETPISCRSRQRKALWNILSLAGKQSTVIGWWASWPAEPVQGILVSDRVNYARNREKYGSEQVTRALTYPEELFAEIEPLVVRPGQITISDVRDFLNVDDSEAAQILSTDYRSHKLRSEFRFLLSQDLTYTNVAKHLLETRAQPDFFAIYLRGIDIISHCALRYSDLLTPSLAEPDQREKYGKAVENYYIFSDRLLGEIIERLEEDTTIFILSDHGFELEENGEFNHHNAPDAIFLAAGDRIQPGKLAEGLSVYDIAPTALYLLGMPVSDEMQGEIIWDCLNPNLKTERPPRTIATYGPYGSTITAAADPGAEREMIEHLRALGYLN